MYPTAADFIDFLVQANILKSRPEDTEFFRRIISSATLRFEKQTMWSPFYSDGLSHTYQYDVRYDSNSLWLKTGLITLTSVYVGGSPFVVDTNVWARGGYGERPNDRLEFLGHPDILHNIVSITGVWGYTQTIDDTVNNAILKRAAAEVIVALQGPSGRIFRERQGPLETFFDPQHMKTFVSTRDQLREEYKEDIAPYRRKRF